MMPQRGKIEAIMGYTITPTELKSRLDKGEQLVLLTSENMGIDLAKLNGSTLIPLATLPQSLGKLNRETEIVAICHHGMKCRRDQFPPPTRILQREEPGGRDRCLVSASGSISSEILVSACVMQVTRHPSVCARLEVLDRLLQAVDQIGFRPTIVLDAVWCCR